MRPIARLSVLLALLAAACLDAAAADDLGTLFTSPEERARLDKLRRGEPTVAAPVEGVRARHERAITGYVKRSDGRNTVWIDGRPVILASPDGKSLLEPRIVQPRGTEPLLHPDEDGKAQRPVKP